jgi:hypothetical protein
MSTLSELGDYLEGKSVSAPVFLGSGPDDPDTVLTLYEYPGGPPEYVQESQSPNAETAQIQVVARAVAYDEASALIAQAWAALASVINTTLSGTKYRSIRPNSSPAVMGQDSNGRMLLYFNATVEKEVSL